MPTLGYYGCTLPDGDDGQLRHDGPRACSCGAPISPRILALRSTATRCSWCALKALSRDAEDGLGPHDAAIGRALKETP